MSDAQSIVKNASIVVISEIASRAISFVLIIILAKFFGDAGLGKYSFIFAFVGIFSILSDFGISGLMTREVARDKTKTEKYIANVLGFKIVLCIITILLPSSIIFFTDESFEIKAGVLLAGFSQAFYYLSYPFRNVFNAYERQFYHAMYSLVERIVAFVLGVAALYLGYGLLGFIIVLVFSNLVSLIYSYAVTLKKFSRVAIEFDIKFLKETVKGSLPFWFTTLFITIYFKIDTVMLGFMKGFEPTGWYNASYKIIDALSLIPLSIGMVLFPVMSRYYKEREKYLQILYVKVVYYLFILALPIAVGIAMTSQRIILFVYGNSFENSAASLQILVWALLFIFVNYIIGSLLNSIDKQILFTYTTGFCAILNVGLNFLLIPKYSYIGAAIATVLTELVNFIVLFSLISKEGYNLPRLAQLLKPVLASFLMGILLLYTKEYHLFIIVPLSAAFYFGIMFLIKGVGKEEINLARLLLKNDKNQ